MSSLSLYCSWFGLFGCVRTPGRSDFCSGASKVLTRVIILHIQSSSVVLVSHPCPLYDDRFVIIMTSEMKRHCPSFQTQAHLELVLPSFCVFSISKRLSPSLSLLCLFHPSVYLSHFRSPANVAHFLILSDASSFSHPCTNDHLNPSITVCHMLPFCAYPPALFLVFTADASLFFQLIVCSSFSLSTLSSSLRIEPEKTSSAIFTRESK